MTIDTKELLEAINIIAQESNVRIAVQQSAKGALVCAAGAFIGGILMGPAGLALGGAAGGAAAYKITSGTFRPLGEVILNDLTDCQREELVQRVSRAIANIDLTDAIVLLPIILNNVSTRQAILNTIVSFVSNELKMQIQN